MAFRLRLLAGLAFSLLTIKCRTMLASSPEGKENRDIYERQECPLWVVSGPSWHYQLNVRFRG